MANVKSKLTTEDMSKIERPNNLEDIDYEEYEIDSFTKSSTSGSNNRIKKSNQEVQRQLLNRIDIMKKYKVKNSVKLKDSEDVQLRIVKYLQFCYSHQEFPTIMGLAAIGFGISRRALDVFLRENPGHPTTSIVEEYKELIADLLTNASLNNSVSVAQAIFQLKNHYGHADKIELEAVPSGNARFVSEEEAKDIIGKYTLPSKL